MYFCSPAQVMKLVDMRDLKSLAYCWRTGSIPVLGTLKGFRKGAFFYCLQNVCSINLIKV